MKKRIYIPILTLLLGLIYGLLSSKYLLDLDLSPKKTDLTFFYIFNNNSMIILYMLIGTLTLGIYTLFIIFVNGMTLGVLFQEFYKTDLAAFVFLNTFPHGIIEITGFIVAAIGDMYIVKYLLTIIRIKILKRSVISEKSLLKKGLIMNVIALFIITIATIVEVYII